MPFQPRRLQQDRVLEGTTTERGYGWAHQQARKKKLAESPICEMCEERLSTDLHHIDRNPHNRSESNLLALCQDCHHSRVHGGS